jgi:adhesin/invasin
VTFAVVLGGGTVNPTTAVTTGTNGIASVTSWTLGPTAGTNTLTATSGSLSGSPVTFTATGTAGAATQIAINGGNNQSATVGTAVATPPSVIVKDASNNPVAGVSVTFAVASGGGSAAGVSQTTDGSGIATVGNWTLGTTAGSNTLTAISGSLSGSPVTFTATGTAGPASTLAVNGGNNQSATVNTPVATPPSVVVRDQFGNGVAGVTVTFAVTSGGGSLTGSAATTNDGGVATVGSWTLGTTAGANTLTATSGTLGDSPVTFNATGTPDVPSSLVFTVEPSTTQSNTPMVPAVVVTALDQFGNTATGFTGTVTLTITQFTGTPGATLSNGAVSAAGGVATFSNLSIDLPGTGYELDANASGVTGVTSTAFDITIL